MMKHHILAVRCRYCGVCGRLYGDFSDALCDTGPKSMYTDEGFVSFTRKYLEYTEAYQVINVIKLLFEGKCIGLVFMCWGCTFKRVGGW